MALPGRAARAQIVRESANPLGAFLRARRGLITPEQAGIPALGARRVPGLRREEVAMLAGISADYYLRLERGRDRNPSAQVLDSIARVLRLDDDHRVHLRSLAAPAPRSDDRSASEEPVPESAVNLLHMLGLPAFIEDRLLDIVAANTHARAVSARLAAGRNQLRDLLLDPEEQALHPEWRQMTECLVGSLRQNVGNDVDDPRTVELVAELFRESPRFGRLWTRHEVRSQRGATLHIDHPQVGQLTLNRERLAIAGTTDMMLVVYHPGDGSGDADKLALLASAALSGTPAGGSPTAGRR